MWKGLRSLRTAKAIIECRNTAGCVTFVIFRSSSVPSNIRSLIRNPNTSLAVSNFVFANGKLSYRRFPIPTYCAPCPGKTTALFIFRSIAKLKMQTIVICNRKDNQKTDIIKLKLQSYKSHFFKHTCPYFLYLCFLNQQNKKQGHFT